MGLKHDSIGFLVGDKEEWNENISQWADIAEDVRAIKMLLDRLFKDGRESNRDIKKSIVASKTASAKAPTINTSDSIPAPVAPVKSIPATVTYIGNTLNVSNHYNRPASVSAGEFSEKPKQSINPVINVDAPKQDSVSSSNPVAPASKQSPKGESDKQSPKKAKPKDDTNRDASGRFVGGERYLDGESRLVSAIDKLSDFTSGAGGDDIDPAISATKEALAPVAMLAKPMGFAFKLFGEKKDNGEPKSARWYKKIYRRLRRSSTDENKWNKKHEKHLENIEKKPTGARGNKAILAILVGIAVAIFAFTKTIGTILGKGLFKFVAKPLLKLLGKTDLAGLGAKALRRAVTGGNKGGKGGKATGKSKSRKPKTKAEKLKSLLRIGKDRSESPKASPASKGAGKLGFGGKLARKIPLLAALFAASSVYGSESDQSLSRSEKNANIGSNVGTVGGALAGGAMGATIGTAIFPVIGTAIGGAIGAFLGSDVGSIIGGYASKFFDTQVWSDVSSFMASKWDALTVNISNAWHNTTARFSDKWDSIADGFSEKWHDLTDNIGKKWGDLKGSLSDSVDSAYKKAQASISNPDSMISNVREKGHKAGQSLASAGSKFYGKITGRTSERKETLLREAINSGITDKKELANFMGQTDHETSGFSRNEENLNYSAKGLLKTFKGRNGINTIADARRVKRGGKEAIGNAIYGGKWGAKNLGNTEKGDGYKFRGRGFKQLTGRSNYAQAGKALGIDLENNPDLAKDPKIAAKIATWYWKKRVPESKRKSVRGATKAINGGYNGLADRKVRAAKWEKELARRELKAPTSYAKKDTVTGKGRNSVAQPRQIAKVTTKPVVAKTASIPPPPIPNFAPPNVNVDAPSYSEKTATANAQVRIGRSQAEEGRDVSDRHIAHIVSGNISGL